MRKVRISTTERRCHGSVLENRFHTGRLELWSIDRFTFMLLVDHMGSFFPSALFSVHVNQII